MGASPVKELALELGLDVLEPPSARDPDFLLRLKGLNSDLIVVVAYGQILPGELLRIPPLGCVNVHPSLLPRHRGAAPIPWALLQGDTTTGVTTFYLNEALDAGDIILQRSVSIREGDDAGSLSARLAEIGAELLQETVSLIGRGEAPRTPQDESKISVAPKIKKEQTIIDWKNDAERLAREVKAFSPHPGALTTFRGQSLQLLKCRAAEPGTPAEAPGAIVQAEVKKGILAVATGRGDLALLVLKPAGRREMGVQAFLNGYRPRPGEVLG